MCLRFLINKLKRISFILIYMVCFSTACCPSSLSWSFSFFSLCPFLHVSLQAWTRKIFVHGKGMEQYVQLSTNFGFVYFMTVKRIFFSLKVKMVSCFLHNKTMAPRRKKNKTDNLDYSMIWEFFVF